VGKKSKYRLSYYLSGILQYSFQDFFVAKCTPSKVPKVRMVFFCGTEILNRMKNFQKYVFLVAQIYAIYFKSKVY
jgi:hypothetical protein